MEKKTVPKVTMEIESIELVRTKNGEQKIVRKTRTQTFENPNNHKSELCIICNFPGWPECKDICNNWKCEDLTNQE